MTHPEIEEWLTGAEGVKMNPDGRYGLQCVDLVDQYAQDLFGVHWTESVGGVVGANQLLDRVPDAYWTRIDNDGSPDLLPERGDVLVYAGNGVNQWGHTAVALNPTLAAVQVIQQDGFAEPHQFVDGAWYSAKPAHRSTLGYDNYGTGPILGWLRPRPERIRDTGAALRLAPRVSQVIVEAGDSMGLIAIQYGVALDALLAANPGVGDLIHPGQVLNLP
ncbi:MAG: LysM peptidoglycan-binding domain-containing protein [Actinomycetota bacterium]|nr:LysM peptidoglycan-binding domain-containing protein [Actinomycetota bacterium]